MVYQGVRNISKYKQNLHVCQLVVFCSRGKWSLSLVGQKRNKFHATFAGEFQGRVKKTQSKCKYLITHDGSMGRGRIFAYMDGWGRLQKIEWVKRETNQSHYGSMGLVYLPTWMVDFYGFHVGKYTVRPMHPSWDPVTIRGSPVKPNTSWQPRMIQPRIPETKGQVQPGRLGLPGYNYHN